MRKMMIAAAVVVALPACNTAGTASRTTAVPEGSTRRATWFYYVNPDCSSNPAINVKLTTPPANGRAYLQNTSDYPRFTKANQRYECNTQKVRGIEIMYTPNPGFVGTDRIVADVIYPDGHNRSTAVDINVK